MAQPHHVIEAPAVVAEAGCVLLEGRPGVAMSMSPSCALETAAQLEAAATVALGQASLPPKPR